MTVNCTRCRFFLSGLCRRYPKPIEVEDSHWCGEFKAAQKTPKKRWISPSVTTIREYCQERGNEIDPVQFHDFYAARGWKLSTGPMKDWQAAVRTWEKRWEQRKKEDAAKQQPTSAGAHKPFEVDKGLSQAEKERAAAELKRMQELQKARKTNE